MKTIFKSFYFKRFCVVSLLEYVKSSSWPFRKRTARHLATKRSKFQAGACLCYAVILYFFVFVYFGVEPAHKVYNVL